MCSPVENRVEYHHHIMNQNQDEKPHQVQTKSVLSTTSVAGTLCAMDARQLNLLLYRTDHGRLRLKKTHHTYIPYPK